MNLTSKSKFFLLLTICLLALPTLAQTALSNVTAWAVVDQKGNATAVGGQFSPASSIDLKNQDVTLVISGANKFGFTFSKGSFTKLWFGGYVATATSSTTKIGMLLQPLRNGRWTYSAAIRGFVPGSNSATVDLKIGDQEGSATAKLYVY